MFTALNECNLRLVNRFEFTLMVDVDEFILPYGNVTDLFQMIDGITGSPKMGAFVFKNAFHYLYWSNDTSTTEKYARGLFDQYDVKKINDTSSIVQPYLLTQTKTRRLVNLHNHGTRSKYIVRPDAADMIGNHNVWTFFPGSIFLTHKFYKCHWRIKFLFRFCCQKRKWRCGCVPPLSHLRVWWFWLPEIALEDRQGGASLGQVPFHQSEESLWQDFWEWQRMPKGSSSWISMVTLIGNIGSDEKQLWYFDTSDNLKLFRSFTKCFCFDGRIKPPWTRKMNSCDRATSPKRASSRVFVVVTYLHPVQ